MARPKGKITEETTQNMNIKMDKDDYKELQEIAKHMGISLSGLVRLILTMRLKRVKETGNKLGFLEDATFGEKR